MLIKYPIFGQDKDKWMYIVETEQKLNSNLEKIDIENNEYIGWDSNGKPLGFYLEGDNIKVRCLSSDSNLNELKQAIINYARLANPKTPLTNPEKYEKVTELFKAVENHINQGRLSRRIITKIEKVLKKK